MDNLEKRYWAINDKLQEQLIRVSGSEGTIMLNDDSLKTFTISNNCRPI